MPSDGSEPPVVVGGHAVSLWCLYFLSKGTSELARFLPFTSKDLDLVGTVDLLERLHRELKGNLLLSPPRSPVLGRLETLRGDGGTLRIEVLHTVNGLNPKELHRAVVLRAGEIAGRVLLPHLVLKANIENTVSIEQDGRNDVKHVSMMIVCLRRFLAGLIEQVADMEMNARTVVNLLGEVWEVVNSPRAVKASDLWGFDFSAVWPVDDLKCCADGKITRWVEHRLSHREPNPPRQPPTNP